MFSLIITLISIALVAALALATLYYGGSSFTNGNQAAKAATVVNQGQQILGAMEMFKVDKGRYPGQTGLDGVTELVNEGYLSAVPTLSAMAPGSTLMPAAYAAEAVWVAPSPGVPTAVLSSSVPVDLCREVNQKSRGDNGILTKAYTSLLTQCFGPSDSALTVVVTKVGTGLEAVAGNGNVVDGSPTTGGGADGDGTWLHAPNTSTSGGGSGGNNGGTGSGNPPDEPTDPGTPSQPPVKRVVLHLGQNSLNWMQLFYTDTTYTTTADVDFSNGLMVARIDGGPEARCGYIVGYSGGLFIQDNSAGSMSDCYVASGEPGDYDLFVLTGNYQSYYVPVRIVP